MDALESVGVFLAGIGILLFSFSFLGWVLYEISQRYELKQKETNNKRVNNKKKNNLEENNEEEHKVVKSL